jgi:hypothetical protein
MRTRTVALSLASFLSGCVLFSSIALSWAGPSAGPPNSNVSAPINVGTSDQVKNANIGINGLAVFGNTLMASSTYLDFGSTAGTNGYGIRDNAGTLEFKNYLGSWSSMQSTINSLAGASQWTVSGSNIYNANAGNVGIGTASPLGKVDVNAGIAKTSTTEADTLRLRTSEADASNPFDLKISVAGGAALANRYVLLQTSDHLLANGGNIVLQKYGGDVGIGAAAPDKARGRG